MSRATVGIISIGDMGLGIAKLLQAHDYTVVTNATGRSKATLQRARDNSIELVADDLELCNSDVILSILPPASAVSVAQNIASAASSPQFRSRSRTLYYLDLNAVSPARARQIEQLFTQASSHVHFIDGGIIGAPPKLKEGEGTWKVPSIPLSGPIKLAHAVQYGEDLAKVLNVRHISDTVGTASGLKMCFASLSKGFTALAIQSYSTASNLGILAELQVELDVFSPGVRERAEGGLVSMPPKAYRWVDEMREIAATFEQDGGFLEGESPFRGIAEIYNLVAHDTLLGSERTEQRQRGQNAEDVALLMTEGTRNRKEKSD